ncbi:prolyl oligopeptidase family serine peptidase [Cysteiniphilum sp. 6C5]|uniref:S9 family peptidase n=1 Tax=unclassified Cysteiniphilum TaxID=2610889 RepID=UPI003F838C56
MLRKILLYACLIIVSTLAVYAQKVDVNTTKTTEKSMPPLTAEASLSQPWFGFVSLSDDAHEAVYIEKKGQKDKKTGKWQWRYQLFYVKHINAKSMIDAQKLFNFNVLSVSWFPDAHKLLFVKEQHDQLSLCVYDIKLNKLYPLQMPLQGLESYQISPNGQMIAVSIHEDKRDNLSVLDSATMHAGNKLYVLMLSKDKTHVQSIKALSQSGDYVMNDRLTWLKDSSGILFVSAHSLAPERSRKREIKRVDLVGHVMNLTKNEGYYDQPVLSNDGQSLAYFYNRLPKGYQYADYLLRYSNQLCVLNLNDHQQRCLEPLFEGGAQLLAWNQKDEYLLMVQDDHLTKRLVKVNIKTSEIVSLTHDVSVVSPVINNQATAIGYMQMSSNKAPEAVVSRLDEFSPQVINSQRKLPYTLGHTEIIHWVGSSKENVEGFLTYPPNYKKGQKYPLVVAVHGGPANHWWGSFIGSPHTLDTPFCVGCMAAEGYIVFRPNVHGSTGYGVAFMTSNYRKIGQIDLEDITLGVKHLIAEGIVDSKRIGIWGWSYGGFLAAVAMQHSDLFKTAIDGAGVNDLVSLEGTSDYHTLTYLMGVPFWQDAKPWVNISPVLHVGSVHGSILIQGGDRDSEVPLSQSLELYYALKQAHKKVSLKIYRDQGHEFSDPNQLLLGMKDTANWFRQNLYTHRKSFCGV